ncbi:hypothetical protein HDU97_007187 [Phlyctochytrium planicorne]|nr:hypothetical protein HDU97_007187 [Phlyctochytrium planicorne]
MIKQTSIRTLILSYIRDPYILISSNSRPNFRPVQVAANMIGYREYFVSTQKHYPNDMRLEILYYFRIIHNYHLFPHYRILDSANVFGPFWQEVRKQASGLGPIEDLRLVISRSPDLIQPIARRFAARNIRFFRATDRGIYGDIETSAKFLDFANTIHMVAGS